MVQFVLIAFRNYTKEPNQKTYSFLNFKTKSIELVNQPKHPKHFDRFDFFDFSFSYTSSLMQMNIPVFYSVILCFSHTTSISPTIVPYLVMKQSEANYYDENEPGMHTTAAADRRVYTYICMYMYIT